MAITEYDAPRRAALNIEEDSIEELRARRTTAQLPSVDLDEATDGFELPGADLSGEESTVAVVPMRARVPVLMPLPVSVHSHAPVSVPVKAQGPPLPVFVDATGRRRLTIMICSGLSVALLASLALLLTGLFGAPPGYLPGFPEQPPQAGGAKARAEGGSAPSPTRHPATVDIGNDATALTLSGTVVGPAGTPSSTVSVANAQRRVPTQTPGRPRPNKSK